MHVKGSGMSVFGVRCPLLRGSSLALVYFLSRMPLIARSSVEVQLYHRDVYPEPVARLSLCRA